MGSWSSANSWGPWRRTSTILRIKSELTNWTRHKERTIATVIAIHGQEMIQKSPEICMVQKNPEKSRKKHNFALTYFILGKVQNSPEKQKHHFTWKYFILWKVQKSPKKSRKSSFYMEILNIMKKSRKVQKVQKSQEKSRKV